MISNNVVLNVIRFISLILVHVLVFNKLNFFGYINPMVYILFLYWYPIKQNRELFIALSFVLGLFIDFFSDTMAINTAATVTIAFLRPSIMRFVFGVNYEFQSFKLSSATRLQQFTFLIVLIVIHHFTYFVLEIFSFSNVLLILKKVFSISLASLVLCTLFSSLFSVAKE